ncbi:MAG: tail-specific protease, partial [Gammaproteobacteria bacterium]|nr:tail-specific protease [Gammaproteobacteria bacterium]
MLKRILISTIPLIFSGNLLANAPLPEPINPLPEHRISASLITQFIERFHYKDTELNDEQSKTIFKEYLKTLDPNRSFLTAKDIQVFEKYKTTLDDS